MAIRLMLGKSLLRIVEAKMTVKEIVSLMIEGQIFKVKNERGRVLYNGIREYGRETSINGLENKKVRNICSESYVDFLDGIDWDGKDIASIDEILIIV